MPQGCRALGGGTDLFIDKGIELSLLSDWKVRTSLTGGTPALHMLRQPSLLMDVKELVRAEFWTITSVPPSQLGAAW